MVACNLCGMLFDKNDPDFDKRIARHNQYHNSKYKGTSRDAIFYKTTLYKKRNTVMGIPKYV